MNKEADRIIALIAAQEHVSKEEVLKEMQAAIDAGYNSTDPSVRAQWDAMPFHGKPAPQEFIAYLAGAISEKTWKH
ncbi:MAG: sporulation initiation factor Spo0A [Clostridiales bacterium]|nr:sporulation initiation factor Spo0A [Clostridiales bacterium]